MNMQEILEQIAAGGGEIEVTETRFYPYDDEAIALGLITFKYSGEGWSRMKKLTLTEKGRRYLGLPALPAARLSLMTRLMALFRRPAL